MDSRWLGDDVFLEIPWKTYPEGMLYWDSLSSIELTIKINHHNIQPGSHKLLQKPDRLCWAICSQVCSVVKTVLKVSSEWTSAVCPSESLFIKTAHQPAGCNLSITSRAFPMWKVTWEPSEIYFILKLSPNVRLGGNTLSEQKWRKPIGYYGAGKWTIAWGPEALVLPQKWTLEITGSVPGCY